MITYNHENYVHDAIYGVLNQETTYPIELIIADDQSTDNTDKIIREIIANHPKGSLINYTQHSENLGMMPNFIYTLSAAKGKYIATCEGDDYWFDKNKLQRQIDFLESNPEYSLHVTRVDSVDLNKSFIRHKPLNWETGKFGKEKILSDFDIQTSSFVVRNNFTIPEWYKKIWSGDFFLCWFALEKGFGFYDNLSTSCYRVNPNGGQSFKDPYNRMFNLNRNLIGQKEILVKEQNNDRILKLINDQINEANRLLLGISYELLDKKLILKYLLSTLFRIRINKELSMLYLKSFLAIILPKRVILSIRKK